jgi:hypothetical protein
LPIRTKPWSEVVLQDVTDLILREVREDGGIEFKRQLNLATRNDKAEFLKDVSGMANGVGGTIIYGAAEGDGEQRGQIVRLRGQALEPDAVGLQITNLLRDALDERLDGVMFKALPTAMSGEFVCVLRVPASPLAPHRIALGEKPQFYVRGSAATTPMNTHQIREMMLQRVTAEDRVIDEVERRTRLLENAAARRNDTLHFNDAPFTNPDQVVLHVLPLFPHANGWRLGPANERRLMSVHALGANTPFDRALYSLEGMTSEFPHRRKVLFLRRGGIEFQRYDVLERDALSAPRLKAWEVERDILRALDECAALTADGLLPLPVLVSVRLLDVGGSVLKRHLRDWEYGQHLQSDRHVFLTPVILTRWGDGAHAQVRAVFDEMWQAWHFAECGSYYPDGCHHRYDEGGFVVPFSASAATEAAHDDDDRHG